jgi:hypothetical protein
MYSDRDGLNAAEGILPGSRPMIGGQILEGGGGRGIVGGVGGTFNPTYDPYRLLQGIIGVCKLAFGYGGGGDDDEPNRCRKVAQQCRELCSGFIDARPTLDLQTMHFHRCVNQCLSDQNCGGNSYSDGWDNGKLGTPKPWQQ